jgi:hypothetical protein
MQSGQCCRLSSAEYEERRKVEIVRYVFNSSLARHHHKSWLMNSLHSPFNAISMAMSMKPLSFYPFRYRVSLHLFSSHIH